MFDWIGDALDWADPGDWFDLGDAVADAGGGAVQAVADTSDFWDVSASDLLKVAPSVASLGRQVLGSGSTNPYALRLPSGGTTYFDPSTVTQAQLADYARRAAGGSPVTNGSLFAPSSGSPPAWLIAAGIGAAVFLFARK